MPPTLPSAVPSLSRLSISKFSLSAARCYASTSSSSSSSSSSNPNSYIPSSSSSSAPYPLPPRPKPKLTTFFTGRPVFENAILELEKAVTSSKATLRALHIYPLPPKLTIPQPRAFWQPASEISGKLQTTVGPGSYRRLTSLLSELSLLREIAKRSGQAEVVETIRLHLKDYERSMDTGLGGASTKADGYVDEVGRVVAVGKRKESGAKVWMKRVKVASQVEVGAEENVASEDSQVVEEIAASNEGEESTEVESIPEQPTPPPIPTFPFTAESHLPLLHSSTTSSTSSIPQILINSLPLPIAFPRSHDRQIILRPFILTGTLGCFNIFARVTGGGMTGQAGAVGLAVARALSVEFGESPEREVLTQDGLLARDPRMVERKKTGLAKARKRYTWVKR